MNKPHLPKLKLLVNTPNQWEGFLEMLDYKIKDEQKKLEQMVDPVHIYKAQGAIAVLRQLSYLKDEVNANQ